MRLGKRTRADRERLVKRWFGVKGEVSQAEFARQYSIDQTQFNRWVQAFCKDRNIQL